MDPGGGTHSGSSPKTQADRFLCAHSELSTAFNRPLLSCSDNSVNLGRQWAERRDFLKCVTNRSMGSETIAARATLGREALLKL